MRHKRIFSDMFDLIEVVINFDDKLYKKAITKIQLISKKSKNLL